MTLLAGLPHLPLIDLALLAWVVSEGYIGVVAHRGGRGAGVRRRADRGSFVVVFVGIFAAIGVGNLLRALDVGVLPGYSLAVGLLMIAAGIVVRLWSVRTLGRFFSLVVQVRADHRIVETGPYRWLRHPSYTGVLLAVTGYAVMLGSWAAALAVAGIASAVISYRIVVEEQLLLEKFGPAYRAYMDRTWRLFPFLV